jgi:hypothetical protein
MALPTLLAEDAPHFLRGVGVLPTAALLPVLGLAWMTDRLARLPRPGHAGTKPTRVVATAIPSLFLALGLISTVYDYFARYRAEPLTYHWLEGGPVALASQVNELREAGWDGIQMRREDTRSTSATSLRIYFDANLYEEWTAIPYLIPEAAVEFLPLKEPLEAGERALFVVWPYRSWEQDLLPVLSHPTYIQVHAGPMAQGDLDPQAYEIATFIEVGPRPEVPPPATHFEGGILLRAALVEALQDTHSAGPVTTVNLWWEATQSVTQSHTVFVHYLRAGERIAQHDGPPGLGHLPTTTWHPGDLILDRHSLGDLTPIPATDVLRIGLYDAVTGEGIGVIDDDGMVIADAIEIPVILIEP